MAHGLAADLPVLLQALLDALPEESVVHGHILLKGGAGDIEVGKSQHQRPYKGHRGHFFLADWRNPRMPTSTTMMGLSAITKLRNSMIASRFLS